MQKIGTSALLRAASLMAALSVFVEHSRHEADKRSDVADYIATDLKKNLQALEKEISPLGMPMTVASIKRGIGRLKEGSHATWADATAILDDVRNRLQDEFDHKEVYAIDAKNAEYFNPKNPIFGADVNSKFPSAAFEIDEFGKCYALGRSTASVFHLMRILEISLRAIAKSLAIPDPVTGQNKNWGAMLAKIKAEIDRRTSSSLWQNDDKSLFTTLYASLDAVRGAWRNTTMHVENKYTSVEAEHIFITSRGLMNALSARMDENGMPLA